MVRALKWAGGIFAALVVIAVAALLLFQWNWLRQPAVDAASKALGREITIGDLQGEWSLRPRFVLQDLHIPNAEWGREAEMLGAERIEVVVDLPELLRGRTVLPEIRLVKPKISLERQEDSTNNWTFGAEEAAETVAPEERSEMPLIGLLLIEDGQLVYRDEKLELDIDTKLSTAVGEGKEGRGHVELEGRGNMRNEPFTLKVSAGSLLALREEDDPYPLTMEILIGPTRGYITGTLTDPVRFVGLDLRVELSGPNLGRLTHVTGIPLPMTPPYDLKGRLQREGEIWSIDDLDGKIGESDLSGDLRFDLGRERLLIESNLRSKVLDYRDVGPLIGLQDEETDKRAQQKQDNPAVKPQGQNAAEARQQEEKKKPAKRAEAEQVRQGAPPRVLPDAPLAVEQVREVDARVKFRGEKVDAPGIPLSGVDLNLDMQDGVLALKPIKLGVAGGNVVADIRINAREESISTNYDIRLSGFDLKQALAAAGQEQAGQGQINGRIRLLGIGSTVRQSLGSATGDIRLAMDGGELSNLVLELVGLDVGQAALFLAEGDRGEQRVPVRCFVVDFEAQDGLLKPRTFVLDTTDTTITADGLVSLKEEQLGLRLVAYPKDVSLLSARTPITVNGAFSRPIVDVEKTPLAARAAGAVALGALLTPIASILAFIDPGLAQDSDCAALLRQSGPKMERRP